MSLDEDRYVCPACRKRFDAPGRCDACGAGPLVDTLVTDEVERTETTTQASPSRGERQKFLIWGAMLLGFVFLGVPIALHIVETRENPWLHLAVLSAVPVFLLIAVRAAWVAMRTGGSQG